MQVPWRDQHADQAGEHHQRHDAGLQQVNVVGTRDGSRTRVAALSSNALRICAVSLIAFAAKAPAPI